MVNSLAILLVEDQSTFAYAVEAVLRYKASFQFELDMATDLQETVGLMQKKPYDVVLLDLSLPDSQGLNSLKVVRGLAPGTPVVILTGVEDEQLALQAVSEGAQDYLTKGDLDGRLLSRAILYAIERARMLSQRDDFVAAVVHDLKNPLIGSDRIFSMILENKFGELQPELYKLTSVLKKSNESVLHLLRNLLEIHRYDTVSPEFKYQEIHLPPLVVESIEQLKPLAELKSLSLQTMIESDITKIYGDSLAMHRVFLNLIGNSIKFTSDGGSVHVSVATSQTKARVEVRDTGEGIPAEEQEHLFERFYQGKTGRVFGVGNGLGLYLCRQIIEAHQGTIQCTSGIGQGTNFIIELPGSCN